MHDTLFLANHLIDLLNYCHMHGTFVRYGTQALRQLVRFVSNEIIYKTVAQTMSARSVVLFPHVMLAVSLKMGYKFYMIREQIN